MSGRRTWGIKKFPLKLRADDPRLRPTHTINTPQREAFRQRIVDEHLAGTSPVEGRAPVLYLMGGGGASGKGHVKDLLIGRGDIPAHGPVELDPDEIKKQIPEYDAIAKTGDSRGASVVHQESGDLAKRVLSESIDQRRDIVYDVTLGNPEKGRALIDRAKAAGYEVRLYGVTVDPEVAVQRNGERAVKTGRYVPIDEQLKAHKGFSEGFESYAERVDTAKLYDTNGPGATIIAAKTRHGQLVTRKDEYDAFQKKATLNPGAQGPDELYPDPSQTGAAIRPRDEVKAWEWADQAYERFRRDDSDVDEIAQNLSDVRRPSGTTGFTRDEIAQVKQHLMRDEHTLDDYRGGHEHRQFDASPDIAEAWIRSREGRPLDSDIVLLEHELAESEYEKAHPGATYQEAHEYANQQFNWESNLPGRTGEDLDTSWGRHGDAGALQEGAGDRDGGGVRVRVPGAGPDPADRQADPYGPTADGTGGQQVRRGGLQDPEESGRRDGLAGDGHPGLLTERHPDVPRQTGGAIVRPEGADPAESRDRLEQELPDQDQTRLDDIRHFDEDTAEQDAAAQERTEQDAAEHDQLEQQRLEQQRLEQDGTAQDETAQDDTAQDSVERDRAERDTEQDSADRDQTDRDQTDRDQERQQTDRNQTDRDQERQQTDRDQTDRDQEREQANRDQTDRDQERGQTDREQTDPDEQREQADREQADRGQERVQTDRDQQREQTDREQTDREQTDRDQERDQTEREQTERDGPGADAQRDAEERDTPEQDTPQQDDAQQEDAQQEDAEQEAAAQDNAQQDAAEQDAAQEDAAQQDGAQQDGAQQESAQQESAETASAESESAPANDYDSQASADDDRVSASMSSSDNEGYSGDSYESEPSQDMEREER